MARTKRLDKNPTSLAQSAQVSMLELLEPRVLLSATPGSDSFASRTVISGSSASMTGSNVAATKEAGEPDHAGDSGGHSVWWRWTATSSGMVKIDTIGSNFDTLLGVYTGSSLSSLTTIASSDDGADNHASVVDFDVVSGTTYQIAVDGYDGDTGSYVLTLARIASPPNDNFANRTVISGSSTTVTGNNLGATKEPGEPVNPINPGGHSVWWSWTAPTAGEIQLTGSSTSGSTLLGVYTGSSVSSLTPVAEDANFVIFRAVSGTTYQIAVDGWDGYMGDQTITLDLAAPPPNDSFANRTVISGSSTTVSGSNAGATEEPGEPDHNGHSGDHSVWYSWTASATGDVWVDLGGDAWDKVMGVYTGSSVSSLTTVGSCHASEFDDGYMSFTAISGTTYQFAVDGWYQDTGDYTLTVLADPDDQISEATSVAIGGTLTGKDINVATDVDLFSVSVTAGQRLCFDIDRPGGTLDSYIRLFNSAGTQLAGSNNAPAPGEAANTDSYTEYTFTAAGTYYLGVSSNGNSAYSILSGGGDTDAYGNSTGAYTLVVTLDADPDDTIPGANAVAIGSTITGKAIDTTPDVDLYAVTVTAGQRLCFDIDRPGGTLDSYIRLFNSAGTQLAGSNNAPAPGETATTDSYLEYTFASAGTYYLGVSGNGNSVYSIVSGNGDTASGTTGVYTLVVTLDADPDDTIPAASPLAIGGTVTGKAIDSATDVDLYAVTVTAGQTIAFDIDRPSGTLDSFLRLFNSKGTSLAGSNNAPAPCEAPSSDSYFEYTFASSGTYYLGVSGNSNSSYSIASGLGDTSSLTTGPYTLIVTQLNDPDETIPTASTVAVGSTVTGKAVDIASDVDLFAFTVTAGPRISFDIDRPIGAMYLDSYIRLFNSAGTQLAGSNNAPAPGEAATTDSYLAYTFATAGTYYLGVSAATNNAYSIVSGLGHASGLTTGLYMLTLTLLP